MKMMAYRPAPVREVQIPKEGQQGRFRPLGISNFEDKLVQLMMSKILEAIFEPLFRDCSHGFRPNRSCHTAVKALNNHLHSNQCEVVIDVDLENFFGTIDHELLIKALKVKIKDNRFIRYIIRMLKAGVLSDGDLKKTDEGSPQGNIVSPILSNIFAHYAFDRWFEEVIQPKTRMPVKCIRYCDDIVICCRYRSDAKDILKVLRDRLQKVSLKLNVYQEAVRIFFKWINRRSQRKSLTWEQFNRFIQIYPAPRAKVYQSLFLAIVAK